MQGLIANPFLEGVVLMLLGIGCFVAGAMIHDPELHTVGTAVTGIGIGYLSHSSVQAAKQ